MPQHMDWASEEPCLRMLYYYTAKLCTDLNWKLELKTAGPKRIHVIYASWFSETVWFDNQLRPFSDTDKVKSTQQSAISEEAAFF